MLTDGTKKLIGDGDSLFSNKATLNAMWQTIAEQFYPQRADFTVNRATGNDITVGMTTSYPMLCCRSLSEMFSSMLRPADKNWFKIRTGRWEKVGAAGKRWLEMSERVQRRAMYDTGAMFNRATKEGDADFAAFGQCAISKEINRNANGLIFRSWHLRDMAWSEGVEGKIERIHRKWTPTARDVVALWKDKAHARVKELADTAPETKINVRHIVAPANMHEATARKPHPYVSIYVDVDNGHEMEAIGSWTKVYTIPRWQTVSGSQYAFSPSTIAALPDARLIQAITLALLEAGEKAVNPPMIATEQAIRSDVQLYARGITWVDQDYDERLGEVLRPITQDMRGIAAGMNLRGDVKQMIMEAFYLNKIALPPIGRDMTAFEVGQRVSEYVRNALPLFEPMEAEYNGDMCEDVFQLLLRYGAFGSVEDIPADLSGQEYHFEFVSPLTAAIDSQRGQVFMQSKAMLAEAMALDPTMAAMINVQQALRDTLEGIGVEQSWLNDEQTLTAAKEIIAKQQQAQQMLATMGQGADVAQKIGSASESFRGAA